MSLAMKQIMDEQLIMGSQNTDNNDDLFSPFKGPFKSKGKNNRAVAQLTDELSVVTERMNAVVEEFRLVRPKGFAVRFCVFRPRGLPQLWWREYGIKGKYIKLFDSEAGARILDQMLPATIRMLVYFERYRLDYNLQATMIGHPIECYRKYRRDTDHLDNVLAELDEE